VGVNLAAIVPLIEAVEALIAELRADLDPASAGGRKLTPEERRRVGRRLVKLAGDLAALLF
jgi:hypothetical protein